MPTQTEALTAPALVLLAELALLWHGQRRLFWATAGATRSRLLAYVLAAPGTALHEMSHYLACLALGVPVLGRVRLFWPRRSVGGEVVLGSVAHARTDPMRQALISIAPLVLMPALLALLSAALLGLHTMGSMPASLGGVPAWRAAVWIYISLSCGQAVFPSPGDHIGPEGWLCLLGLTAGGVLAVLALAGASGLSNALTVAAALLALPALAVVVSLVALRLLGGVAR